MKSAAAAFCLLGLSSSSLAAQEPLAPRAAWVVNFADSQCIASRNYGSPEDPLFLFIKAPALGDVLQIGIVSPGNTSAASQMAGEILFDGQAPIPASLLEFGAETKNHLVVLVNLPRSQLASMRGTSTIRIHARQDDDRRSNIQLGSRIPRAAATATDFSFKVTQVPALLQTLDKCATDLRKVWNVEEGDNPTLVRSEPAGDLRKVFSSEDYPAIALSKDQSGAIRVAVLVDEKGKVADCTVVETSGVASLDAQSCALITQHAKIKPAIGLDGKPAKGALLQKITWMVGY